MHDKFSPDFIHLLTEAVDGETTALIKALVASPPSISVRWNPFKTAAAPNVIANISSATPDAVAATSADKPVPWSRYGRYLTERPTFTLDPSFHAGKYYVQEASSMFVEHIFRSVASEGARVLDLCAAPGGKATLYSTLTGLDGLVVANEVIRSRAGVLADNVRKWGLGNVVVTNNDPAHFAPLREWFDIVAVDAPCSGEGMFRKSPEARAEWSIDNVRLCAARQRRILADAWEALSPGGVLIYSTCTFNRPENEENMAWLAENFDCEDAGIAVPQEWGILRTEASGLGCFRFLPHRVEGEGFFACAIRKGGQKGRPANPKPRRKLFTDVPKSSITELRRWVGQPELMRFASIVDNVYGYYADTYADMKTISESLNAIHSGICMGQMFGGKLKPDHSLAMFHDLAYAVPAVAGSECTVPASTVPSGTVHPAIAPPSAPFHQAEVSVGDAIKFLQKENLADISPLAEGLNIIIHRGAALGWAKRIGSRVNNLYPHSLAITGWK